jgi:hypothetical protein
MAEEEKINHHAKLALRSLTNKKKKWKERIKDFFYEIFIIIVAVSITLGFHNWSDKRNDRKLVKEFLTGIRESMIQDTAQVHGVNNYFTKDIMIYYDSVLYQINNNKINAKYIDTNSHLLNNNSYIRFNMGVFQSFSAAGNLRLIENQKLLSDITSYYSNAAKGQEVYGSIEDKRRDDLKKYILSKLSVDSNGNCKLSTIIHQQEVLFFLSYYDHFLKGTVDEHNNGINYIVSTIHEIDKELKD